MEDNKAAPLIYAQISKVMADIGAVSKDRKNEQQKYSFRGIEDFYQAAHPALIKNGVFCTPEVMDREETRFEKTNYEGKATTWIHVVMKVRHRFFASDGSYVDVITCGEGLDNSDKASNKAMSGAMKYALIELFCVPTKDIEDSDRDSHETGTKKVVISRNTAPAKLPDAMIDKLATAMAPARAAADALEEHLEKPKRPSGTVSATLVKQDRPYEPFDEPPVEDEYIDSVQAGKIAKRFRESLRPELQVMAEDLRHDALTVYKKIDKDGNPSALMIRRSEYVEMGKKLIEYARGL